MGYRVLVSLAFLTLHVSGQSPPEALQSFEVASVRITSPDKFGDTLWGPYGTNRYTVTNATLDFLIQIAYGIPFYQISGIDKLGSEHYDVSAKAEDGVLLTSDQLRPRLQRLLMERFRLSAHQEQKDIDGYALLIGKGGPRLKPNTGVSDNGVIYPGGLRIMNQTLSGLAAALRSPAGRPVIDRTGIQGNFDFSLGYARDGDTASMLPSLFTALEEQFGLRLEKAKVPIEILAIDHVEKIPSEN